ncbi:hypothetical protein NPIL_195761 [Nephila pilipes]|uniref:Uncharacterized protein n=1 Tax=Nephila pilipes TaxID=299642 RepID=A0A8X6NI12_NEPPI|nr:hypothetical protein NPIL_195761 [Nephila pilipes]
MRIEWPLYYLLPGHNVLFATILCQTGRFHAKPDSPYCGKADVHDTVLPSSSESDRTVVPARGCVLLLFVFVCGSFRKPACGGGSSFPSTFTTFHFSPSSLVSFPKQQKKVRIRENKQVIVVLRFCSECTGFAVAAAAMVTD